MLHDANVKLARLRYSVVIHSSTGRMGGGVGWGEGGVGVKTCSEGQFYLHSKRKLNFICIIHQSGVD